MNIPMGDIMLVEQVLAEHGYDDVRIIVMREHSAPSPMPGEFEVIGYYVLLETGAVMHCCSRPGMELRVVTGQLRHAYNTWDDFLPSVDVQEWAESRGLLPR